MDLFSLMYVAIGGAVGSMLRYTINSLIGKYNTTDFPYATFFINVSGSFVMGLIAAWFAFKGDASQHWRLFLTTGILGGYTTFSTFSLDAALLYERGQLMLAVVYVTGSVVLGLVGLFAGLAIVRGMT